MNKFQLKHFKAFKNELNISLEGKNLLVYGENGSGKSSLYEAFKILFFKEKIEQKIRIAPTPEAQQQISNDFWSSYSNNSSSSEFGIFVEDQSYVDFSKDEYQPFLISIEEIELKDKISLDSLLDNYFFSIENIADFCENYYQYIQEEVNELLIKFNESIQIEIDREDDYTLKIVDSERNIETKNELKTFFNEAKLNLVLLLLLFNCIKYAQDVTKQGFLLLDDFITSLDISNRSYLMTYVTNQFSDFQTIILTHNVNFFNLIKYIISEVHNQSEKWNFGNMYEFNNNNKFFLKKSTEKVEDIRQFYVDTPEEIEKVGNKIRKRFEVLLYEYSKLLMIGAVEDSRKILERIENQKNLYFHNNKNASDLVDELYISLNNGISHNLKNRLNTKIGKYKRTDFNNIKIILSRLKLYKKITMHPMSHGTIGQASFTTKEIDSSLELLEKFEKYLKDLVDKDVAGV